jgi:hypothetical protein
MTRSRIRRRQETFEFKEAITYLAVAAALTYALGWVVQSFSVMQLNMGPIGVPKETAISSGVACLLTFLPLIAVVVDRAYHVRRNIQPHWLSRGISLVLSIGFPVMILGILMTSPTNAALIKTFFDRNVWTTGDVILLGFGEAVLLSLLFFLKDKPEFFRPKSPRMSGTFYARFSPAMNGIARFYCGFGVTLLFGMHIAAFGRNNLPLLQPVYGGYLGHNVAVRFKENVNPPASEPKAERPVRTKSGALALPAPTGLELGPLYKMTIVVADDNVCVLAPGWYDSNGLIPGSARLSSTGTPTRQPMIKVRWDNILELQEVHLPSSGALWTPSNPAIYTAPAR